MINIVKATCLAGLKLKTHKIRTGLIIAVIGLLFGVAIGFSLISSGFVDGIEKAQKTGLSGRYVSGVESPWFTAASIDSGYSSNPDNVREVEKRYADYIKNKVTIAKKLGVEYDPTTEIAPYDKNQAGVKELKFVDSTGISNKFLIEKYGPQVKFDIASVDKYTQQYHITDKFRTRRFSPSINGGKLMAIELDVASQYQPSDGQSPINIYEFVNIYTIALTPPQITDDYLLPNNAGWKPDDGTIPIILRQDEVEKLLKLRKLKETDSVQTKNARIKELKDKARNLTFQMCYRNSASMELMNQAYQPVTEGQKIIYSKPAEKSCVNPEIVSDKRTWAEKNYDNKQREFEKLTAVDNTKGFDPISKIYTFKVVGIAPALKGDGRPDRGKGKNLTSVINDALKVSGIDNSIPAKLYEQMTTKDNLQDLMVGYDDDIHSLGTGDQWMVEFADAKSQQKFIDDLTCETGPSGKCEPAGRKFMAGPLFNNATALDEIIGLTNQISLYFALAVTALSILAVMIIIGRNIDDSRQEIAVFRAIGYARIDIALIYSIYILMIAILIAVVAIGVGYLLAATIDTAYSPWLSATLQYNLGTLNSNVEIHLVKIDWQKMQLISGLMIGSVIIGAIIPLIRNVLRRPVNGLRE